MTISLTLAIEKLSTTRSSTRSPQPDWVARNHPAAANSDHRIVTPLNSYNFEVIIITIIRLLCHRRLTYALFTHKYVLDPSRTCRDIIAVPWCPSPPIPNTSDQPDNPDYLDDNGRVEFLKTSNIHSTVDSWHLCSFTSLK